MLDLEPIHPDRATLGILSGVGRAASNATKLYVRGDNHIVLFGPSLGFADKHRRRQSRD